VKIADFTQKALTVYVVCGTIVRVERFKYNLVRGVAKYG